MDLVIYVGRIGRHLEGEYIRRSGRGVIRV